MQSLRILMVLHWRPPYVQIFEINPSLAKTVLYSKFRISIKEELV